MSHFSPVSPKHHWNIIIVTIVEIKHKYGKIQCIYLNSYCHNRALHNYCDVFIYLLPPSPFMSYHHPFPPPSGHLCSFSLWLSIPTYALIHAHTKSELTYWSSTNLWFLDKYFVLYNNHKKYIRIISSDVSLIVLRLVKQYYNFLCHFYLFHRAIYQLFQILCDILFFLTMTVFS